MAGDRLPDQSSGTRVVDGPAAPGEDRDGGVPGPHLTVCADPRRVGLVASRFPAYADDDVHPVDPEAVGDFGQRADLNAAGVDILELARLDIVEVVMRGHVGVVEHLAGVHQHLPQQALAHEQPQGVVHGGLGHPGPGSVDLLVELIGGEMGRPGKHSAADLDSLLGRYDTVLAQIDERREALTDRLVEVLETLRGEVILLSFFATWNNPCIEQFPALMEVDDALGDRGRVLAVSYDLMTPGETRAGGGRTVRAFLDARGWDLDLVIFDGPGYKAINERFGLPGEVPVTLALDRRGRIVDRHEGPADRERLADLVRRALSGR